MVMKVERQSRIDGSDMAILTLSEGIPMKRWTQVLVDGEPVDFHLPTGSLGNVIGVSTDSNLVGKELVFI